MVNNNTGLCHVNEQGQISYTDEEGKTHTLLPDGKHDEDNSFVLKRLMSKITMNIREGKGVKFTPRDYTVRHIPHYVSPTAQAWTEEERDRILVEDAKPVNFSVYWILSLLLYTCRRTYAR